jgi:hypothetical protein
VRIKVERSGGFAGISSSNEIDADKLPTAIGGTVRELLRMRRPRANKDTGRLKGAADYLTYKITIQDGKKNHVIECKEFDMDDSLKSLVGYVQKTSNKQIS